MIQWLKWLGLRRFYQGRLPLGGAPPNRASFSIACLETLEPRTMLSGNGMADLDLAVWQVQPMTTTHSDAPIYIPVDPVIESNSPSLTPLSNTSGPLIRIDDFRSDVRFSDIDGRGFAAVIMDTGIDLDDPFFGPDTNSDGISDRIVYTQDFTGSGSAGDARGHGSNVSSIVASSDSTYTGMAPGADIIHLKVIGDSGSGSFGWLESGLQWVVANADTYNIASVNLSLGDSGNFDSNMQLYGVADEFAALAAIDVMVVAAAGNDFFVHGSVPGVSYPAADPNTITVGAVYDANVGGTWSYGSGAKAFTTDADRITPFSQRHASLVDVFAPGAPITGAGAGTALTTQHGTSQAAPHVAGAAVLAQQLAVQTLGRRLTVSEFRSLLTDTGVTIHDGDDENDNVTNTGLNFKRLDVLALAQGVLDMAPPAATPEIAVTDNGSDVPDDSGSVDFGTTVPGSVLTKTFTITNQGNGTLTLSNASLNVPAGFSLVTSFSSTTLAEDESATFTVQLDAATPGLHSGTLSFTNNDADETTYDFTVSGTVLDVSIIDNGQSGFSTAGTWSTWSTAGLGRNDNYQLAATGNGSTTATWAFGGIANGQYRVSSTWFPTAHRATDAPFTLYDGANPMVTVDVNQTLSPSDRTVDGSDWNDLGIITVSAGLLQVQLSNDADQTVTADAVMIERVGNLPAGPEISVRNASTLEIADGTGSVDLGTTDLNTPVTHTFSVTNDGSTTLTLDNGSFSLPTGFSLHTGFATTSLALGQSTSFTVQLDATTPGLHSGTLSFTNNDADETTYDFTVSGTVNAMQIIDNGQSGFSTVGTWGSWSQTGLGRNDNYRIANPGDGSTTATWAFGGIANGQYRVSSTWFPTAHRATDAPFTLYDGANPMVTVDVNQTLSPSDRTVDGSDWNDLGIITVSAGLLQVQLSNDADQTVTADAVMIERVGNLPAGPEISVRNASTLEIADGTGSVDLGTTDLNTPVTHTFSVTNDGSTTLTLDNGSFSLPTGFSLHTGFATTSLALGQSTSFTVQLDATTPGLHSGTLSFTNNDADETTYDFTVSGTVNAMQVIDNGQSGFSTAGTWSTWSTAGLGRNDNYQLAATGNGSTTATWAFGGIANGQYRVSSTWFPTAHRATDAPFTLYDGANPMVTVDVNQTLSPSDRTVDGSDWNDLGIITVSAGLLQVQLSNDADQTVTADAVMIERVGNLPAGPEISVRNASTLEIADGTGSVDLGTTDLNTPVTHTFSVTNDGSTTLTLDNGSFSLPTGFSLHTGFATTSLALGQSTSFTVQLDATTPGLHSGTLSFTNNDADETTYDFTVSGTVNAMQVIDNGQSGFSTVGTWGSWSQTGLGRNDNYRIANPGDGSTTATWAFGGIANGQYRVSTTWFPTAHRATDAPFTLYDGANPMVTVDVNQTLSPSDRTVDGSDWNDLGVITVSAGLLQVQLSNDADQTVTADAVMIERI